MNTLQKLAEIRVMELKEYVLPSIASYLKEFYELDISVDELATEALKLPITETRNTFKDSSPMSTPVRSGPMKGCQFLMKNSRTRPNMPCEKSCNGNKYFCKKCTEKASFKDIVKEVSQKLSISVEELTKDIGAYKKKEEGIAIRAPRVPEKRDKYTGSVDKESSKKNKKVVEEEKVDDDAIELSAIPDMEVYFCYDDKTNIAYYYDEAAAEPELIAFGVYKVKEDKIRRLSEQEKVELRAAGTEIGDYDSYKLGDKKVN